MSGCLAINQEARPAVLRATIAATSGHLRRLESRTQVRKTQPDGLDDDAGLIARAQRRQIAAFDELVSRYRSKVYSLALRMLSDTSEAEEVVQEAFLSAWQSLPAFRGDSAFGSWLYRICANLCLMRLRRTRIEARAAERLPGPSYDAEGTLFGTPSYDWTRGTEEKVLDRELRSAIEHATSLLSHENRAVFLLVDVEGLSYEEVARILRLSVPAVKSRLHRARLALRETIEVFFKETHTAAQR